MKLLNYKQGSPEWLAMRKKAIGASDAAAITGVSPYKTKHALWLDKVTDVESIETSAMTYGKQNEEPARQLFENLTGITMFADRTYAHDTRHWQIASLDGISLEQDIIVEIKCANRVDHEIALTGKVPEKYYPQVQHQLAVCDLKHGFYFSYRKIPVEVWKDEECSISYKEDGIIVEVTRDDAYLEDLLTQEDSFYYRNMLGMEAPELSERDYIEMRCEIWDQHSFVYQKLHKEIKALEEKRDFAKNELIRLANQRNCKGNGVVLTKSPRRGLIDYKAIVSGLGIDAEQYRKKSTEVWRIDVT
jgi:putative phage-type endonuclease